MNNTDTRTPYRRNESVPSTSNNLLRELERTARRGLRPHEVQMLPKELRKALSAAR